MNGMNPYHGVDKVTTTPPGTVLDPKTTHGKAASAMKDATGRKAPLPIAAAAAHAVACPSAVVGDNFAAFVRAYDAAQAPENLDQLLSSLRLTISAAGHKFGASDKACRTFFKELKLESLNHQETVLENVAVSAALLWTSAKKLQAGSKQMELCALLNRILREGDPELLQHCCSVVRGINLLCVTRRQPAMMRYPRGGKSHRGGGLPLAHVPFFKEGKKYRVPMFLATSFNADVAYR
jgi:hypothetical protein